MLRHSISRSLTTFKRRFTEHCKDEWILVTLLLFFVPFEAVLWSQYDKICPIARTFTISLPKKKLMFESQEEKKNLQLCWFVSPVRGCFRAHTQLYWMSSHLALFLYIKYFNLQIYDKTLQFNHKYFLLYIFL